MRRAGAWTLGRMFSPLVGRVPAGHLWYLWRRMKNERPHWFADQVRINTFFPPWPSPAFDRFVDNVAARRRVPYSLYVAVTSQCPYHCDHCSYARRAGGDMDTSVLVDVVRQAKELGVCTVGLTGGEPLVRADLEEIASACKPEMATVLFTTGAGLDARRARGLREAGVDCVTVGVESSEATEHDRVRGAAGSWETARAAVAACREAGVYAAISTVGFREKMDSGELERMWKLGRQWGAGEFRVLAPVATGGLAGCGAAMLGPEALRSLSEFHVRMNRCREDGPAVANFAYLESAAMFGCGAGYHHLFVDARGEVCPCDLTPLGFANVREESLAAIWSRMEQWFARPRCGCLMGRIADCVAAEAKREGGRLPLGRETSERICTECAAANDDEPLPEGYRRLLRGRSSERMPTTR